MIQPTTPIAITMPAERWEMVLRVMDEAPICHRVVDPLMREIQSQCMREDRPASVTQFQEAAC